MIVSSATSTTPTTDSSSTKTNSATDPAAAQDRFLKLLVAQLNNQDPMNPLDNAQMTSQIAQINTVTGVQQLNETVKSLASQFAAQQLMQGSNMVGRQVLVEGNTMTVDETSKKATGAFDLAGSAASVTVQVLDPTGKQVGAVEMGSLPAGRYNFTWDAAQYQGDANVRFKVVANNAKAVVEATPLAIDKVVAVSMDGNKLQLQLGRGGVATQDGIKAIL